MAFRSVQGMLLPMVTAILSVLWGLGVLAMSGIHMDALNSTTPILIMAVATGHAVQILKRYYEELEQIIAAGSVVDLREANRLAVSISLAKVGPVMLTAGVIAAIAFFSMEVSDVMMVRHFGIFAGSGVLAALIIEFTFIPALRSVLPVRNRRVQRKADVLDRALAQAGDWLTRSGTSRAIVLGAFVLICAASYGLRDLRVDNSVKQYNPPESAVRRDDAVLNAKFGGTDSILFLVEGQQRDAIKDPRVLEGMSKLQAFLESQPYVGKTQSMADLIKRMNQSMHGDDRSYDRIPDSANLVSQYLLLYSISGDPQDFNNLVDNDYRRAVVWAYLKTDSTAYAKQLYTRCQELIAKEFPPGITVRIGGVLPQTVAINSSLVESKLSNILQMAIVVMVLAGLALRSPVGGLMVVIPIATIVVVNLGLMGWIGVPLDMGTATTAAMVTGIGADYEIYMLYRLREEYQRTGDLNAALRNSLLTSGKAVLFVALSIAGGYSALLVSDFRFYPRLGLTMMVTMAISAVLSLLFLRAIIAEVRPRFIVGAPARIPVKTGSQLLASGE
jgi:predicted RND superfamily exporter protein